MKLPTIKIRRPKRAILISIMGLVALPVIIAAQSLSAYLVFEAEQGSLAGQARTVSASTSSNGAHIEFSASSGGGLGVLWSETFSTADSLNNLIGQGSDGISTTNNPTFSSNGHDSMRFHGDHDLSCGTPYTTRTIQGNNAWPNHSYWCPNGGGHFMTAMNNGSYVSLGFTPKGENNRAKIFPPSANKVCIDVNTTGQGNRRWWDIVVVSEQKYLQNSYPVNVSGLSGGAITNQPVLFYIDPDHFVPDLDVGYDAEFQFVDHEGARFVSSNGRWTYMNHGVVDRYNTDKAARFQVCLKDNGNGTVTHTKGKADGTVETTVMTNASFPTGNKVFIILDKTYNADKAENPAAVTDAYTWHWDNFIISAE